MAAKSCTQSEYVQKTVVTVCTFVAFADCTRCYTFDENYITLTQTRGDVFMSTLKARYSYIYKAREDNRYFYLFISKTQSHVIDKSSITQGALEEIAELLKTNLGNKFKKK